MFINDYRSPIFSAIDDIGPMQQLLFPFMNFTCSGNITRLIFVARRAHQLNLAAADDSRQNNVTSWPMFSLWHNTGGNFMEMQPLGPMHPNQIVSVQPASRSMTGDSQEEVFMINIMPPIQFQPGYVLGLRQNSMKTQQNWHIKVLRQRGGYGLKCDHQFNRPMCLEIGPQEMPYIAVKTSK